MTRADIIRMAREARLLSPICDSTTNLYEDWVDLTPHIERFANLVAAAEREAMVALAAEQGWAMKNEDPFEDAVREIAQIRARGQA